MDRPVQPEPRRELVANQQLNRPAAPVMDVRHPVQQTNDGNDMGTVHEAPADDANDKSSAKVDKPKTQKPPKVKSPHQPGVAGAIVASVVIVLGLAVLAVYAYLKSQNIALL